MRTDELYHYGVLGMKWGVRRYQNKDGTLNPKGKKRLRKDEKKIIEEVKLAALHNEVRRQAGNQANYYEGVKGKEGYVKELDRIYTQNYHSVMSDISRYDRKTQELIERYGAKNISDLSSNEYKENVSIMNNIKKVYGRD